MGRDLFLAALDLMMDSVLPQWHTDLRREALASVAVGIDSLVAQFRCLEC